MQNLAVDQGNRATQVKIPTKPSIFKGNVINAGQGKVSIRSVTSPNITRNPSDTEKTDAGSLFLDWNSQFLLAFVEDSEAAQLTKLTQALFKAAANFLIDPIGSIEPVGEQVTRMTQNFSPVLLVDTLFEFERPEDSGPTTAILEVTTKSSCFVSVDGTGQIFECATSLRREGGSYKNYPLDDCQPRIIVATEGTKVPDSISKQKGVFKELSGMNLNSPQLVGIGLRTELTKGKKAEIRNAIELDGKRKPKFTADDVIKLIEDVKKLFNRINTDPNINGLNSGPLINDAAKRIFDKVVGAFVRRTGAFQVRDTFLGINIYAPDLKKFDDNFENPGFGRFSGNVDETTATGTFISTRLDAGESVQELVVSPALPLQTASVEMPTKTVVDQTQERILEEIFGEPL